MPEESLSQPLAAKLGAKGAAPALAPARSTEVRSTEGLGGDRKVIFGNFLSFPPGDGILAGMRRAASNENEWPYLPAAAAEPFWGR